jgi:hypothetical protein
MDWRVTVIQRLTRPLRLGRLVIAVVTKAIALEVTLRRRPIDRVIGGKAGRPWPRLSSQLGTATVERAIREVYRVMPFQWTCLKHALVVEYIRRGQGLPAELRIGVQKKLGVFGAHAWVEDGRGTVITDPLEGFQPMPLSARSNPGPPTTD